MDYPIYISVPGHPVEIPSRVLDHVYRRFGKNIKLHWFDGKNDPFEIIPECKMIYMDLGWEDDKLCGVEKSLAEADGLEIKYFKNV